MWFKKRSLIFVIHWPSFIRISFRMIDWSCSLLFFWWLIIPVTSNLIALLYRLFIVTILYVIYIYRICNYICSYFLCHSIFFQFIIYTRYNFSTYLLSFIILQTLRTIHNLGITRRIFVFILLFFLFKKTIIIKKYMKVLGTDLCTRNGKKMEL